MELERIGCSCKGESALGMQSLRSLSFKRVRRMVCRLELSSCSLRGLLPSIARELYDSIFHAQDNEFLLSESAKKTFKIWLLFFDKERTKNIDLASMTRDFCLELITYLEKNVTHLESLELYYNWILNEVYIGVFKNLPHLKTLTVLGNLSNTFLNLISDHCRLEFLEIKKDDHDISNDRQYGRSSSVISKFFTSQKTFLQKVDLNQIFKSGFHADEKLVSSVAGFRLCLKDFEQIECIKSLTLSSDMFMLLNNRIPSLLELVIDFEESTNITLSGGNIFGSILELCPNMRSLSLFNLELNSQSALIQNDASEFMVCEDSFIQSVQGEIGQLIRGISVFLYGETQWTKILQYTPNVETASFELENDRTTHYSSPRQLQTPWNNLRTLSINGPYYICDFNGELQPVLINSPKLEDCNLLFFGFTHHLRDAEFLQSLKTSSLRALKSIRIRLSDRRYTMTAKIVFELLSRCHHLRAIDNFSSSFSMNADEIELILDMTRTIGFKED